MMALDRQLISHIRWCQPCSAKLSGAQTPSLWLLCHPRGPPLCGSRWLTGPGSFQTVERRQGTKPERTHPFCSHPHGPHSATEPQLPAGDTRQCRHCSERPYAHLQIRGSLSPWENHTGKQPRAPSRIREGDSREQG